MLRDITFFFRKYKTLSITDRHGPIYLTFAKVTKFTFREKKYSYNKFRS